MSTDMEQLLREGIDRLTAGADVPPGIVGRARRRHRQRRLAIRTTAAAGTALVIAVAAVVAVGGARRAPRGGSAPVHTVAYVTSRARQALAAQAAEGQAIEEERVSGPGFRFGLTVLNMALTFEKNPTGSAVVPGLLANVTAPRLIAWTYRGRSLSEGISATGALVFHNTFRTVTRRSGRQVTQVFGAAYPARTRWHTIVRGLSGPAPSVCQMGLVSPSDSNWRADLSKLLSCGLFRLDGRQRVDGVEAIRLVSVPRRSVPTQETVWVGAATYLPVRVSVTWRPDHGPRHVISYDYRWLPATKANLAAWRAAVRDATIPPGFRLLPPDYLPLTGAK